MKSLHDLVYEKLVINRDTKEKSKVQIDPIYVTDKIIGKLRFGNRPGPNNDPDKNREKMEAYMKKGSKPLTLAHTIKDEVKLMNRWFAAMELKWNEAIQVFGEEIEKRGYATLEELHGYILFIFKNSSWDYKKQMYKNYVDLYNIDYGEYNIDYDETN